MPRLILGRERRTDPLVWLVACACAALATAVIVVGLVVIIIYVVYQPKVPSLKVSSSQLLRLDYAQPGLLGTRLAVTVVAVNSNAKSHVRFSDVNLFLRFHRITVAELRADPFDVPKNGTFPLGYVVESWPVPLDRAAAAEVAAEVRMGRIWFELEGRARTRWRVGALLKVKFWTHLSCNLMFFPSNGSSIGMDCTSKSHI